MKEVVFTPEQLIVWFVAVCAGFSTIATAIAWIVKGWRKAHEPTMKQDERLNALESEIGQHRELLRQDKERFDAMEEGNRITQQAILALLSHGIDGNEIEGMQKAKERLQEYLINK